MALLDRLEAEFPSLKRAAIIFCALAAGWTGGLWYRAEQVSTAKNEAASARSLVTLRDAEIVMLRETLKLKDESAATLPVDKGAGGGSEGAAPPPKKWPSDPDTDVVETGKPKEDSTGWKTLPAD